MARKKPNYEAFRFQGTDTTENIDTVIKKRTVRYEPTGYDDQHLAVYRTVPLELRSPEAIVRLSPWSDDFGRPENALFDAYLAEVTGREVLSPNAPGVDFSRWRDPAYDELHRMTPDQREQLHQAGSFQKVGHAVVRAVAGTMERTDGGERGIILHGSSMGVAMAGGAIRGALEEGVSLKGIALEEGVNADERSIPRLGVQFLTQFADADGYIKQNPERLQNEGESMPNWLRRTGEAMTANAAYVRGLARASFLSDALGGLQREGLEGVPVYITRGTASSLATERGFQAMRQGFESVGAELDDQEFDGHTHPYTMTVQSVVNAIDKVA